MDQPVDVERDGEIAIVTVNVPEKRNAMDVDTREALRAELEIVEGDDSVRAIVLRGGGETFISGSDVSLFLEMNPFDARAYTEYTQGLYDYVESIPNPAIAGYAMGAASRSRCTVTSGSSPRTRCSTSRNWPSARSPAAAPPSD